MENEAYQAQNEKKLQILLKLSSAYSATDADKCLETSRQAIDLAGILKLPHLLAKAFYYKSVAHKNKGEFDKALNVLNESIKINQTDQNESEIAAFYLELGDIYRMKNDFESSKENLYKALELFEKQNDNEGIARAYSLLGNIYLVQSDFTRSAEFYEMAMVIFERTDDHQRMAGTLSNLGGVYYYTGDYPKAIEQFQKALTINEKAGNKLWMIANLGNAGNIYFELSDYEKALECFHKAYDLGTELNNNFSKIGTLSNIGSVYVKLSDDEKALEYYLKALQMANETGDYHNITDDLYNLGELYLRHSRYAESFENIQKALALSEESGAQDKISFGYICKGNWFHVAPDDIQQQLGFNPEEKNIKSVEYIQKGLKIAEEINVAIEMRDGYEILSEVYEFQGKYKSALDKYKKFIKVRDKIQGEESKKQVTRKEMQYEFDKKEALAIAEQEKKDALALKEIQRQKLLRNSFIGGFSAVLVFAGVFFKQRNKIREGKKRSDELLLNILPEEVAEELKAKGSADAKQFDEVTVMFTDFKGFTKISERLSASELVTEIDTCFKAFDHIISKYNIEKIKTIGDSYMCAGGLPVENRTNAEDVVRAALEIQEYMKDHLRLRENEGKEIFEIRTGIHTGPVVAGIVGVKKFAYDIWGNTVNIASRMESSGEAGKVNISGATYELVKDKFNCTHRGKVGAKNIGEIDMYFVESINN